MTRAFVIADDLTGAADTGLAFWMTGLSVTVLPDAQTGYAASTGDADVLALSTETRNTVDEASARATLRRVAERHLPLPLKPSTLVYKKIDSTLRGWVGAEVGALLDAMPGYVAWVVPAYPRQGRRVRGGVCTVQGVPLHETEFARDVKEMDGHSYLPAILERQVGERVAFVDAEAIRVGEEFASPASIAQSAAAAMRAAESRVVLFDAESNAAIDAVAEAGWKSGGAILWVGSAGLAKLLVAEMTRDDADEWEESRSRVPASDTPVVFVVGSQSIVAREQMAALTAAVTVRELVFAPNGEALPGGEEAAGNEQDMSAPLLLRLTPTVGPEDMLHAHRIAVADEFGRAAAETIQRVGSERILLTGGDTAAATLRHLGVVSLEMIAEVDDGIPFLRLRGGTADGAFVVTKAGGFGSPDSLLLAFALLSGEMEVVS